MTLTMRSGLAGQDGMGRMCGSAKAVTKLQESF